MKKFNTVCTLLFTIFLTAIVCKDSHARDNYFGSYRTRSYYTPSYPLPYNGYSSPEYKESVRQYRTFRPTRPYIEHRYSITRYKPRKK